MKNLFYTFLILGLILFCYWYITREPDIVKVDAKIHVLQEKTDGNDYRANILGTAENTGTFPVKNVWIIYKIGNEEVTAFIGELKEGQIVNFRTGARQINTGKPDFELVSVKFEK